MAATLTDDDIEISKSTTSCVSFNNHTRPNCMFETTNNQQVPPPGFRQSNGYDLQSYNWNDNRASGLSIEATGNTSGATEANFYWQTAASNQAHLPTVSQFGQHTNNYGYVPYQHGVIVMATQPNQHQKYWSGTTYQQQQQQQQQRPQIDKSPDIKVQVPAFDHSQLTYASLTPIRSSSGGDGTESVPSTSRTTETSSPIASNNYNLAGNYQYQGEPVQQFFSLYQQQQQKSMNKNYRNSGTTGSPSAFYNIDGDVGAIGNNPWIHDQQVNNFQSSQLNNPNLTTTGTSTKLTTQQSSVNETIGNTGAASQWSMASQLHQGRSMLYSQLYDTKVTAMGGTTQNTNTNSNNESPNSSLSATSPKGVGGLSASSKKLFVCYICSKAYARPSTLRMHMRIHSGVRPYHCRICNKSFCQTANLSAHLRTHNGDKPFSCPMCHRKFSQSSSVKTHMRVHTGQRPYKCQSCSKTFSDSSTLAKHRRTHNGDRPYMCSICYLRFTQSGNLNRHMRIHRGNISGGTSVNMNKTAKTS